MAAIAAGFIGCTDGTDGDGRTGPNDSLPAASPQRAPAPPDTALEAAAERCARAALAAMESKNLDALAALVHPEKGVAIEHASLGIEGNEAGQFSAAEVRAAGGKSAVRYRIYNGYNEDDPGIRQTLAEYLEDFSTAPLLSVNKKVETVRFSERGGMHLGFWSGNGSYALDTLSPGQTMAAFYVNETSDTATDDYLTYAWEHLIFRTEMYRGKPYLVQIMRQHWTP